MIRRTANSASRSPTLSDVLDTLHQVERRLDGIEKVLAGKPGADPALGEEFISLAEAAFRAGRTIECVRGWAKTHGLGHKIGGRWRVSSARLANYLRTGEPNLEFLEFLERNQIGSSATVKSRDLQKG